MAHDTFQTFGDLLVYLRKRAHLTQAELGRAVGYGREQIVRLEKNQRVPDRAVIAAVFIPALDLDDSSELAQRLLDLASPTRPPRTNLPAQLTSFIGREAEVAKVHGYLFASDKRLVTLIGPPGIGKTRLSVAAARDTLADFPDGVFFVALAPLDQPNLVAPTIVQTLGFVETKNRSASERLTDGIGDKQMLLVLDNVEHLIEGTAPLVSDLLIACPRLKILTTSREALRVSGEWLYRVPTLSVPTETQLHSMDIARVSQFTALALFAERARAVRTDFSLDADNIQTVATICAQVDGLPLAIELLAARIRLMSPQVLRVHLSGQFVLSVDGMRAVSARQKTLHNAIAWSYNLLSAEEQELFARLSVFSGGFTLDAAEAVFSRAVTDKSVSDLIASLFDKSLLQRTFDEHGEPRFNMLVTIQQFAQERLCGMGEEAEARAWHLAYFLDLAEQANREIHGPDQVKWIDRIETEYDNYRAALEWCISNQKAEAALRLLGALAWVWLAQDRYGEPRSWFDKIRSWPEISAYPELYACLLNWVGHATFLLGDYPYSRSVLEESRRIWLKLGVDGERGLAEDLNWLGMVALFSEGDFETAQSFFEQSYELCQKCGDQWGMAFVLLTIGKIASERNDDASALALYEQSLDLFQQLGDVFHVAKSSQRLGELCLKQGNYEKARSFFDQHLRIDEELHFKQGTAVALFNFGELYRYQGDYVQAEQFYEKSLAMCREYDLKRDSSNNLFSLGLLALHRNNYRLARRHFTDAFDLAWPIFGRMSACDLLTGLAAVAARTKQPQRAAKLSGAAQALFETTDYRIPPFDRAEFDRHIYIAREQLGEAAFEEFVTEGYAMTLEQAIEYAFSDKTD